jgi:hypothetical protein
VQNSAARDSMKTITSKTALFLAIHYSSIHCFSSKQSAPFKTCYVQILQKHPWVIFIASHLFTMSASMLIIFATTSQNFMVFQIRGHRFSIFGSSISAIFFRVNHPKLLHMKRNSFKTTIISPSMPYILSKQSTIPFKTNMLWANSSKTFMGYFYRKPLVSFHANHFSMPTISVIVATTSQNLMVFIKYFVTVPFLGQAFRQFSFGLTIQNFSM